MVFDDCASPFVSRLSYRFIVFKSKSNSIHIHRDNFYSTSENSTKLCSIFLIVFSLCYVNFFFDLRRRVWIHGCLFNQKFVSSTKNLSFRPKIPPQQIFVYKSHKIQDKMNYCRIDYTKSTKYHSKMTFQKRKKSRKLRRNRKCARKRLHPLTKFHSNESHVHDYATLTFFSFSWI